MSDVVDDYTRIVLEFSRIQKDYLKASSLRIAYQMYFYLELGNDAEEKDLLKKPVSFEKLSEMKARFPYLDNGYENMFESIFRGQFRPSLEGIISDFSAVKARFVNLSKRVDVSINGLDCVEEPLIKEKFLRMNKKIGDYLKLVE